MLFCMAGVVLGYMDFFFCVVGMVFMALDRRGIRRYLPSNKNIRKYSPLFLLPSPTLHNIWHLLLEEIDFWD